MEFCVCNGSIQNTGAPSKQRVISSGVKLIAVRMKADDGSNNDIASDDVIDQAYIDALINNADESKRWYPIGIFKNQEDVRSDPQTESLSDGSTVLTNQGVRSFTGWLINFAAAYLKALESFKCQSFGLYVIDDCGGLIGSMKPDGTALRPIRVNEKSWNPTYVKATPTVAAKVQLTFEFSQLEKDKYLRVISDEEVTADLLDLEGLIPLDAAISGITTTGFVAAIKVDFDIFLDADKEKAIGWEASDFEVYNTTTSSTVAITSVTEAPDGTYTFVIPAQTSEDVLTLTNVKTSGQKPGFGLKETITIP